MIRDATLSASAGKFQRNRAQERSVDAFPISHRKRRGSLLPCLMFPTLIIFASILLFRSIPVPSVPAFAASGPASSSIHVEKPTPAVYQRKATTFLLGIFTMKSSKEEVQRRLIRNTMLATDLDGKLCSLQKYRAQTPQCCQVIYTFVMGMDKGPPKINLGDSVGVDPSSVPHAEPDVTFLNITENMNDGKVPTWFNYAASSFPEIDYIAKSDSDTMMSIPRLLEFVNSYLPNQKEPTYHPVFGGTLFDVTNCGNAGHCRELKGRVYMSGAFYFISQHLVKHITNEYRQQGIKYPFEDMDFGTKVSTFDQPIALIEFNTDNFWKHLLKGESKWMYWWNMSKHNHPRAAFWNGHAAWRDDPTD